MLLGAGGQVSTIIIVLIVAGVAVLAIPPLLAYLGARQRKAVRTYAEAQGWQHRDNDDGLAARYSGPPFVGDPDARAEAVISGVYRDLPFAAYAYTYVATTAGDSGSTRTIPVVALSLDSELPDLDVVPVPSDDDLWGDPSTFGVIPRSAEFARAFLVRSGDDDFAQAILSDRLTHALLAFPDRAWALRDGDLLSIASWNGKPEKIVSYLDHLGVILEAVPAGMWAAYGSGDPPPRVTDEPGQPNNSST